MTTGDWFEPSNAQQDVRVAHSYRLVKQFEADEEERRIGNAEHASLVSLLACPEFAVHGELRGL